MHYDSSSRMDVKFRQEDATPSQVSSSDEQSLVREILAGNRQVCEDFILRYKSSVLKVINGKVPAEMVEELFHTTFICALKSLPIYDFRKPLKNWLSRIATCRCYDYWRAENRKKKEIPASSLAEYHEWANQLTADFSSMSELEEASLARARGLTTWAFNQLSAEDRMVVTMIHLEGYSTEEAAELLGWNAVTVRVRAFRSRKKLRKLLSSYGKIIIK